MFLRPSNYYLLELLLLFLVCVLVAVCASHPLVAMTPSFIASTLSISCSNIYVSADAKIRYSGKLQRRKVGSRHSVLKCSQDSLFDEQQLIGIASFYYASKNVSGQ